MTEMMFRGFCQDRGLEKLLGSAEYGHEAGLDFVEFKYLQPAPLQDRGVDWLDVDESLLEVVMALIGRRYRGRRHRVHYLSPTIIRFLVSVSGTENRVFTWHLSFMLGQGIIHGLAMCSTTDASMVLALV